MSQLSTTLSHAIYATWIDVYVYDNMWNGCRYFCRHCVATVLYICLKPPLSCPYYVVHIPRRWRYVIRVPFCQMMDEPNVERDCNQRLQGALGEGAASRWLLFQADLFAHVMSTFTENKGDDIRGSEKWGIKVKMRQTGRLSCSFAVCLVGLDWSSV